MLLTVRVHCMLTVVTVCYILHWHQLAAAAKAMLAAHHSTSTAAMRCRRRLSSLPCSPQAQCRAIWRAPVQSEQGSVHCPALPLRVGARVWERLNVGHCRVGRPRSGRPGYRQVVSCLLSAIFSSGHFPRFVWLTPLSLLLRCTPFA